METMELNVQTICAQTASQVASPYHTDGEFSVQPASPQAPSQIRPSYRQFSIILSYMEKHPELITGKLENGFTPMERRNRWRDLTKILNEQGRGAIKTPDKWRKTFSDWKGAVKVKAGLRGKTHADCNRPRLNELEEKLLKMLGSDVPPAISEKPSLASEAPAVEAKAPATARFVLQSPTQTSQTLYLVKTVNPVQTLPIICTTDCPPAAASDCSTVPPASTSAPVPTSPDAILGDANTDTAEMRPMEQYLRQLIKTETPETEVDNDASTDFISNLVCSIDAATQTDKRQHSREDYDGPSLQLAIMKMMETKEQELELQREQSVQMAKLAEAAERFAAAFEKIAEKF